MFKGVQKRTTHFEKIAFKVNALAFQRIKIVRKPEYRGDFILQFSHVFWTIFAMGTYTVDQISFNGNVYAEIRKSTSLSFSLSLILSLYIYIYFFLSLFLSLSFILYLSLFLSFSLSHSFSFSLSSSQKHCLNVNKLPGIYYKI